MGLNKHALLLHFVDFSGEITKNPVNKKKRYVYLCHWVLPQHRSLPLTALIFRTLTTVVKRLVKASTGKMLIH